VGRDSNGGTGLERWDGTQTVGRDSNGGTGLKRWDGTQTVGRDSNGGTGLKRWDGTRTVERDTNGGTGHERWNGTRTVGRDANGGTGRDFVGGDKASFVRLRRTGTACFVPRQSGGPASACGGLVPPYEIWDGTRTVGRANSRIAPPPTRLSSTLRLDSTELAEVRPSRRGLRRGRMPDAKAGRPWRARWDARDGTTSQNAKLPGQNLWRQSTCGRTTSGRDSFV
jgi:hypothetical protein